MSPSRGLFSALRGAISQRLGDRWLAWTDRRRRPLLKSFSPAHVLSKDVSIETLVGLIKADLAWRFRRGERPSIAEYLERFPALNDEHTRMVSLVYEEYCLREESGEPPSPEEFCKPYEKWRDSILLQLRYHRDISQIQCEKPPSDDLFPKPGQDFRGFKLEDELGQGGTARVYRATETNVGQRTVALKISPDRGDEAAIQGRLSHPHIVPVWSVVLEDPSAETRSGLRGLCMPYKPGTSLDVVIRSLWFWGNRPTQARDLWEAVQDATGDRAASQAGHPEWRDFPSKGTYADGVAWLIATLADALSYAHGSEVQHRDVKPANILMTIADGPMLLDFNLAHSPSCAEEAHKALRGGTVPYMAPEQLEAFSQPGLWDRVGPQADIYSLGLVMRELLTGKKPLAHDPALPIPQAMRELLCRRREVGIASARQLNPGVPHALDSILDHCLAENPKNRYGTARQLSQDLRCYLQRLPLCHTDNRSIREEAVNTLTRLRRPLLAAALVAGVAVALGAAWRVRHDSEFYFLEGERERNNGEIKLAIRNFESGLDLVPDSLRGLFGLAEARQVEGDYPRSVSDFSRAIALALKGRTDPSVSLADLYLNRAETRTTWGYQLQGRGWSEIQKAVREGHPPPFGEPHPLYVQAGEQFALAVLDLEATEKLSGTNPDTHYRVELARAKAEMGLGDVEQQAELDTLAMRRYREAFSRLDGLLHDRVSSRRAGQWSEETRSCFREVLGRLLQLGSELHTPPPSDHVLGEQTLDDSLLAERD